MILQFCWSFSYICSFENMLLGGRHQIKVFPLSKKHFAVSNFIKQMVVNNNVYLILVTAYSPFYGGSCINLIQKKKKTHA